MAGITEESALYDKHQAAAAAALAGFKSSAMGEPELVTEFEERLAQGEVHLQAPKQSAGAYRTGPHPWLAPCSCAAECSKVLSACAPPCLWQLDGG